MIRNQDEHDDVMSVNGVSQSGSKAIVVCLGVEHDDDDDDEKGSFEGRMEKAFIPMSFFLSCCLLLSEHFSCVSDGHYFQLMSHEI